MAGFLEKNIASAAQALERTVANERWCRERGFAQRLDPRLKLVVFVAVLLACSLAHSIIVLLCLYALATALAFFSRIAVSDFTGRVWVFVPVFTAVVAIPALFLTPGTRIAAFGPLAITHEGARTAFMLVLRVSTSVSYSVLLVLTTPWNSIVRALRHLRLPGIVVTILSLCYRYLLLLLRTLAELFMARKSRVIQESTFRREAAFACRSGGYLFLKSLHLAEGVYLALVSRGWNEEESKRSVRAASNPGGCQHDAPLADDGRRGTGTDAKSSRAETMTGCAFDLENVRYAYPGNIAGLAIDTLGIPHGRCTILLGPNGSGKSTLLKVLDGLIYPQAGSVRVFGMELSEQALKDRMLSKFFRSKVGLVFQDADVQCFSPTVREELAFGPRQTGLSEREVERRVEAALAVLGISALGDRYPYGLSGGEKKRVALASILTMDLDVYLLDEPTANLDPATEGVLIDILSGLAELGKTLVIATQDLMLARHIGDFAVVLGAEKRPLFMGPVAEALENAALLESAGLVHAHKRPHRQAPTGFHHTHYTEEKSP
jgi:cobalt/nickel transport system ATP-binding protein